MLTCLQRRHYTRFDDSGQLQREGSTSNFLLIPRNGRNGAALWLNHALKPGRDD
jgi:hypothetical protein